MNKCRLVEQGFKQGSCLVFYKSKELYTSNFLKDTACRVTLKQKNNTIYRLIKSAHLSRPEHYFSIYQSGCNLTCKKCHSWEFTQYANGKWLSPDDIAELVRNYNTTYKNVMYKESKEYATSFHAQRLCKSCGFCITTGKRSEYCPNKLEVEQIVLSPQGFGPARNIIAFTGGDISCQPEFYTQSAEKIKQIDGDLLVLFETNGYGLTPKNLDLFKKAGIDAFWLDIKAYDNDVHKELTGVENDWILKLPGEILDRNFTLEVLSLYIPGLVEEDQIVKIAQLLSDVDKTIPFTVLAFFPEYKLMHIPPPNLEQMLSVYDAIKKSGLKNIRLGNLGQFIKTKEDYEILVNHAGDAI